MLIHINLSLFSASCGSEKACSSPDVIPIFGTKEGAGIFHPIQTHTPYKYAVDKIYFPAESVSLSDIFSQYPIKHY